MNIDDLKHEYKDVSPGDYVTVRLSKAICIPGCMVLSRQYTFGKVLYTVAVPTGEDAPDGLDDCGCLVNANLFLDGKYWVRWENLDSVYVLAH